MSAKTYTAQTLGSGFESWHRYGCMPAIFFCFVFLYTYPGEIVPGTQCTGGRVGPRTGPDVKENTKISCPYDESSPDFTVVRINS
jgi:hypothetical protein